jgi:acyl-CoA dehydrogenase
MPTSRERLDSLTLALRAFLDDRVYPAEAMYFQQLAAAPSRWSIPPIMEELKAAARAAKLWNLFLPDSPLGAGLSNAEYAPLCELMGRSPIAPEVFNCAAPDTGNMEVLVRYGTPAQQERWLKPLLAGEIRSCFAMTEPAVASSDATNIECRIRRDGDDYVIDGRKWWTSGAMDPRCAIAIVMGKTDPSASKHLQQSMILVPMATPGVEVIRPLTVFGYDDAPHGHAEVVFRGVRVPAENILLGEGRGFEIAQGRLGPGRIHHCMRLIGVAERALEAMCKRAGARVAFGRPLADQGALRHAIATSRIEIDQARLLTMAAAHAIDDGGAKSARKAIAMIKVVAPNVALAVIDRAIQVHGGAGVSQDFPLAYAYAHARTLRLADGPDEVHLEAIAKQELSEQLRG